MTNKTFSQKVARLFEIVCYGLLVPVVFLIIYTFVYGTFLFLIPFVITCIGLILLLGYRKHARGTLNNDKLSLLWLGTLFFNGTPLIPVFYYFVLNSSKIETISFEDVSHPSALILILLISWWITAVSCSITFIIDELRRDVRIK